MPAGRVRQLRPELERTPQVGDRGVRPARKGPGARDDVEHARMVGAALERLGKLCRVSSKSPAARWRSASQAGGS